MAISLKEQLRILNEGVHYRAPFKFGPKGFSVLKKGREDEDTRKVATQMFYDFYAMELMHRLLGSPLPDPEVNPAAEFDPDAENKMKNSLTRQQQAKFKRAVQKGGEDAAGAMYVPNWGDVEEPTMGGTIVPANLRKVIDQVYDEVVTQITDKIMTHLRLGLIQEFRYLITHAHEWQYFRQRLVAIYNKNGGKISNEEFAKTIQEKIPRLQGHEDAVKRLLKFCKYYSGMNPDPADAIPKKAETPKVGKPVDLNPEPKEPEPEPEPKIPEEPDDTDYNMPPVEIPPGADWDEEPYKYSDEVEKAKLAQWLKTHKNISEGIDDAGYAAGRISPHTILSVRQAINKSGLTWSDILLAYNNLAWSGPYGGAKWGAGVESYIKLLVQRKDRNIEDMASLVDHIYDLQHNTGALLNKGGMYVSPEDLDRRAKVTHLARYLKDVSPLIQRLILRVLPYVSSHPEIDKNPETVTQSATAPMPAEAVTALTANKFAKSSLGNQWTTQSPFENKQGTSVQDEYTAKYHINGMYSVEDSLNTDIQVFEKLEDFERWLKQNSPNFITPSPGISHYTKPKVKTEKQKWLEKQKLKLDAAKETVLLEECKMAWRPSESYYKAYLPGGDRFQFFAFADGTFMGCVKSTNDIGATFDNWPAALNYCKAQTANALPNENYVEGKAWIGKPIGSSISAIPTAPKPSVGTAPTTKYSLSPMEVTIFNGLVTQKGNDMVTFCPISQ